MPFPWVFPYTFRDFFRRWITFTDIEDTTTFSEVKDGLMFKEAEDTITFTEVMG